MVEPTFVEEAPMRTLRTWLAIPLALVTVLPSTSAAQHHVVNPAALAQAVAQHAAEQDANRAIIREALSRPDVQSIAQNAGVDVTHLAATADTLTGDNLARAAAAASVVNESFVGGASTLVISTTTIIIVLLLVLL